MFLFTWHGINNLHFHGIHSLLSSVSHVCVCIITTKIKYPKTNWNKVRIPVSLKKNGLYYIFFNNSLTKYFNLHSSKEYLHFEGWHIYKMPWENQSLTLYACPIHAPGPWSRIWERQELVNWLLWADEGMGKVKVNFQ